MQHVIRHEPCFFLIVDIVRDIVRVRGNIKTKYHWQSEQFAAGVHGES